MIVFPQANRRGCSDCDVVRICETFEIFPLTAHSLGDTKLSVGPRDSTDSEPKFITKAVTYNFLDCLHQKGSKQMRRACPILSKTNIHITKSPIKCLSEPHHSPCYWRYLMFTDGYFLNWLYHGISLLHLWWLNVMLGAVIWVDICVLLESKAHLSMSFWLLKSPLWSQV